MIKDEQELVRAAALFGVTHPRMIQAINEVLDEAFASMDRGDTDEQKAILDKELSDRLMKVVSECHGNGKTI